MTASRPALTSTRHLLPLDGIRGLAVLVVIVHNSAWVSDGSQYLPLKLFIALTASGWIGVQVFFALSGFLITGILLDAKGKARYFRSFYARRTLRIFPLYFAFIGMAFLLGPRISTSTEWIEAVRVHQWRYWFYLSNWFEPFKLTIHGFSHLWSLAVEEQFYLMWPLLVGFSSRRTLVRFCVGLILVSPLIRLVMPLAGLPPESAYHFTISRWDALAAGALIAVMLRDETGVAILDRWTLRVTGLGTMALIVLTITQRGFHTSAVPVQVIGQSLIAILSACALVLAVREGPSAPRRLQQFLSRPLLRTFGKYSYAMYVFHFPIHHALVPHLSALVAGDDTPWRLARTILYLALVLGLTFLAALLSWRLIERPFLELKDRIAPRSS